MWGRDARDIERELAENARQTAAVEEPMKILKKERATLAQEHKEYYS